MYEKKKAASEITAEAYSNSSEQVSDQSSPVEAPAVAEVAHRAAVDGKHFVACLIAEFSGLELLSQQDCVALRQNSIGVEVLLRCKVEACGGGVPDPSIRGCRVSPASNDLIGLQREERRCRIMSVGEVRVRLWSDRKNGDVLEYSGHKQSHDIWLRETGRVIVVSVRQGVTWQRLRKGTQSKRSLSRSPLTP